MTIRVNHGIRMAVIVCALGASVAARPEHAGHAAAPAAKTAGASANPRKAESKSDKGDPKAEKGDRDRDEDEKGKTGKGEPGSEERDKGAKGDDDEGRPGAPPGLEAKDDEHHKRLLERFEERRKTAPDRAKHERDEIRKKWGKVLDRPEVQQEIRRHAETVARLERIKDIADVGGKAELSARVSAVLERENARHEKGMAAFAVSLAVSGGAQ